MRVALISFALSAMLIAGSTASLIAAEPRPWLCRDVPVFSSAKPIMWRATLQGGGQWLMTFMHYDPAGGHDGFTVVSTSNVRGNAAGALNAGQWYAVALYRAGDHWICPGNASDDDEPPGGAISSLCYGRGDDGCDVSLIVRPAESSNPH
ncbi:MAG TPA: hypothetical protein VKS22_04580 [Candidatus Binataceae bacterium]|nr:hypothetical protein [Candidatus Binataceae bacterium]